MAKKAYRIPAQIGYTKSLTFRMAPVSKAIMSADADWLYDEELCIDSEAAQALLMPFLEEFLKKPFQARDEINIMGFSRVKQLVKALRDTALMLDEHFDDPGMKTFKDYIPLTVIVPPEERDRAAAASLTERRKILKDNVSVVTSFYTLVADYLTEIIDDFSPKGFKHIAVTSPV